MPRRAHSPCPTPGCPNLTEGGRCLDCRNEDDRRYHSTAQARARKAIYNSPLWRRLRRTALRSTPWCAVPGCPNLATDIDHVVPLRDWQGDPFDRSNLQPLCKKHHSEKTAREVFGFKAG